MLSDIKILLGKSTTKTRAILLQGVDSIGRDILTIGCVSCGQPIFRNNYLLSGNPWADFKCKSYLSDCAVPLLAIESSELVWSHYVCLDLDLMESKSPLLWADWAKFWFGVSGMSVEFIREE